MRLELLRGLIEANLAAAAAILLVVLLRRPVRRAVGPRVAYGLWALAPVAAMATLIPARTVRVLVPQDVAVAPAAPPLPVEAIPSVPVTPVEAAALALDVSWSSLGIWLAGVALMFGWLAFRQGQFVAGLRAGKAGPAVVGVLRPRIVLPSDFEQRFTPREQSVVLAHEKAHLARQDARINALAALCRCLFWFNPLVHIAAHLMRVDQELACDAAVLLRHPKARRPYAEALFKAQLAARPLPLGCYWPAGADHPLTERIALLKKPEVGAARVAAGATGVVLLAAGGAVGAWAAQPPKTILDFTSSAPAAPTVAIQFEQPSAIPSPYLAPSDRISVTVAEQPLLSREVTVDARGMIRLPLTGDVKVAGLTLAEAAIAIEAVFGENLLTPKVTIVRLPHPAQPGAAPSGPPPASQTSGLPASPMLLTNADFPYRESAASTAEQRAAYVALNQRSQASDNQFIGPDMISLSGDLRFPDGSRAILNLDGFYSGRARTWTTSTPDGALRLRAVTEDGRPMLRAELAKGDQVNESDPIALREGVLNSVALPGGYQLNVTADVVATTPEQIATLRYMRSFMQARAAAGIGPCSGAACNPPGWDYRTEMGRIRAELGLPN